MEIIKWLLAIFFCPVALAQGFTVQGGSTGGPAAVSPASATLLINFNAGSSGAAPTATTIANSIIQNSGYSSTIEVDQLGAGMEYQTLNQNLFVPVSIAGESTYTSAGPFSLYCTTGVSVHCGQIQDYISTLTSPSVSLGFTVTANNCPAMYDCGAIGGMFGGLDYSVLHVNPAPGTGDDCNSTYSGLILESRGGNSSQSGASWDQPCIPYSGQRIKVNIQANTGETPFTATFTASSSTISGTNTLATNQSVQLSTTGTLPSGFLAHTTYYVLPTPSGSSFQLALTQGGSAIVAGNTGTGVQTVTVFNQLTVCTFSPNVLLGNVVAPAYYTEPAILNTINMGYTGEEPSVAGPTTILEAYILDPYGDFSATSCIL